MRTVVVEVADAAGEGVVVGEVVAVAAVGVRVLYAPLEALVVVPHPGYDVLCSGIIAALTVKVAELKHKLHTYYEGVFFKHSTRQSSRFSLGVVLSHFLTDLWIGQ